MSTKKKASGAQNRKRKADEEDAISKLPKIIGFLEKRIKLENNEFNNCSENADQSIDHESNSSANISVPIFSLENELTNLTNQLEVTKISQNERTENHEFNTNSDNQVDEKISEKSVNDSEGTFQIKNEIINPTDHSNMSTFLKTLACEKFPSDKGHYGKNILLSNQVKRFILDNGPCRPTGKFPKDKNNNCFSDDKYFLRTEAGLELPRNWICYSPTLDVSYCEPCWLFGRNNNQTWADGFNDWMHLIHAIKRHERSNKHVEAAQVHAAWKKGETLDKHRENEIRKETKKMRKILERVMKVVLVLAEQNLAFRGKIEKIENGEVVGGNFLSIIKLLAEYDQELKDLIDQKKGSHKYLSPQIQNELIELLASKVKDMLLDDIKEAPFFSIVLDTTPDITHTDQLSFVFRYVKIIYDNDKKTVDLQVKESFIEFHPVDDHTAGGLEAIVKGFIEKNNIDFSKCRGQAYDGASVMSGAYTGLQARLQKMEKNAKYVHCAAHRLNLVLNDAVNGVEGASNFFKIIGELHNFFSASVKRWKELHGKIGTTVAVKKLCATRWASREDALKSLHNHYPDIMRALTEIILKGKGAERSEAQGFKNKLSDFNFILMLTTFYRIFQVIGPISKDLQSESIDMIYAERRLNDACAYIKELRQWFHHIKGSAVKKAELWGFESDFKDKRLSKVPMRLGELSQDERIEDPEKRFEVESFNPIMDIILARLEERFKSFKCVVNKFRVLNPNFLRNTSDEKIIELSEILCEEYNDDLNSMFFPSEMLSFRKVMSDEINSANDIKDLAISLICGPSSLTASLQGVVDAYILFLTLPVTSATNERTFSKLKLIKSYSRSVMSQNRLSGLALLSIEKETASKVDLDKLIDTFASVNIRRQRKFT